MGHVDPDNVLHNMKYDRDEVKRLEREIELEGNNRFVGLPNARPAEQGTASLTNELEAEWMAQHEILDYTNWLQREVRRLRAAAVSAPEVAERLREREEQIAKAEPLFERVKETHQRQLSSGTGKITVCTCSWCNLANGWLAALRKE